MIYLALLGLTVLGITAMVKNAVRRSELRAKGREAMQRQAAIRAHNESIRRILAVEREQEIARKEREQMQKQLADHEERLMKLEHQMALNESEIAFNREQRNRLFALLDIEERERDASIEGSSTWQKHQRKVISLENQIHAVQKRIDKAKMSKQVCKKKMEVA